MASGKQAKPAAATDFVEVVACPIDELKDNELKEVEIEGKKILVVRNKASYYAVSSKCTHYGAPLSKGALCNGHIRCPWHGACFDVATGDIEDFPGLDSLQKFEVIIDDTQVKVRVKKTDLKTEKRIKVGCRQSSDNKRIFLIIGGGGAGAVCAETLRQEGFAGKIILATKEKYLPYDRPKLNKDLHTSPDDLALRKKKDYVDFDIQVMTKKQAKKVDFTRKIATFEDGMNIAYNTIFIATGCSPNTLDIPGKELRNIFVLRSMDDGNLIAKAVKETKKVVIIGTSFIGLEVAAYLAGKVATVTVVGRSSILLKETLGDQVGLVFQKILESKGVHFIFNSQAKQFVGKSGKLSAVLLANDTRLEADICILGVGGHPTTEFLKDSGIEMSPEGYILVDKHMQCNIKDVYAGGDIVKFPLFLADNKQVNIQHWQMACQHGKVAGTNMAGKVTEVHSVPFFWTMLCGKSLRYAGYGAGYTEVILHGDMNAEKFITFYIKDDQVIAVASMNFDPVVSQAAEMMLSNKRISKADITANPTEFWKVKT